MVIEPFDAGHLDAIVECVTSVWTGDNVIARALGVTAEDYRPVARRTCQQALDDGMGVMVRDPKTDAIEGFMTCVDLADELTAEEIKRAQDSPRIRRWSALLMLGHQWFLDEYYEGRRPSRGEVVYMDIGGSRSHLRGRGFVTMMLMTLVRDVVHVRGFSWVLAMATHPHSVEKTKKVKVGARLHSIPFASLADPDLSRITEPPELLVSVTPVNSQSRPPEVVL